MSEAIKRCSGCSETKPLDAFSVSKKSHDGHQNYCKECRKRHHETNKKHDSDLAKKRHQENLLADHERNRLNYEANKAHVLKRCAEYRKTLDPEMVKAYRAAWRKNNGQYIKAWLKDYRECYRYILWAKMSLRSHRRCGFEIEVTPEYLAEMGMNTPFCPICGTPLHWGAHPGKPRLDSPSMDRIDNGNTIAADNISIICMSCNSTKGARSLPEFIAYCKTVADRFAIRAHEGIKVVTFEET